MSLVNGMNLDANRTAEVRVLRDLEATLHALNKTKSDVSFARRLWLSVRLGITCSVVEAMRADIEQGGVTLREIAQEGSR